MESASIRADAGQGTLRHLPEEELRRIRELDGDAVGRAEGFADACRINALYMIARAGSGHIGTSFSCMEILSWLHLEEMDDDDLYFSSKGHDAPALYSVLIGLGRLDFELIHRLRRLGGLPGHPDVLSVPQVNTNTGSLGMGVSKAKGFIRADRAEGRSRSVYVLTGDGELQEGQFWESLGQAANDPFPEITAIVDHNKIQSDTWVSEVSDLGDLEAKVGAFGWAVGRCDGNDVSELRAALGALRESAPDRPKLLVADTRKGAGVSFMEPHDLARRGTSLYGFHSGAPSPPDYARALGELQTRLTERLARLGEDPPALVEAPSPPPPAPGRPQKLIDAYGRELARLGEAEPRLRVLDADLYLDCGLIPFRERFPERFIECGIAEQDMVSQAGAMALGGLLPVVHSFACFLSTRPNEQIYNNSTEGTKVIYVGSLVGLVPGGPGHSHQSVRDISALGAMPGMEMIEPHSEHEAGLALRWAVEEAEGPVYIRLVSVPWELPFEPQTPDSLDLGRGDVLREGPDVTLVAAGPVMLASAWGAADLLAEGGISASVVNLPWLRSIDGAWLAEKADGAPIFCLDNHYTSGGQGDAVLAALAEVASGDLGAVHKLGVESVPVCGTNDEVLRAHKLDPEGIAERVVAALPTRV